MSSFPPLKITAISVANSLPLIFVSISGFLGNGLVILSVIRERSLRTTSNFYVINLAICDILVCLVCTQVSVITVIYGGVQIFNDVICDVISIFNHMLCISSMLTLFAFSVYRYYIVTNRFHTPKLTRFVVSSILSVWVISFSITLPPFLGWGKITFQTDKGTCTIDWAVDLSYCIFHALFAFVLPLNIMCVLYFRLYLFIKKNRVQVGPRSNPRETRNRDTGVTCNTEQTIGSVIYQNTGIGETLPECIISDGQGKKSSTSHNPVIQAFHINENLQTDICTNGSTIHVCAQTSHTGTEDHMKPQIFQVETCITGATSNTEQSIGSNGRIRQKPLHRSGLSKRLLENRKLVKVLVVTILVFASCWTPYAVDVLMTAFGYRELRPDWLSKLEMYLAFGNSCCNPIIYAVMNKRFRQAFYNISKSLKKC